MYKRKAVSARRSGLASCEVLMAWGKSALFRKGKTILQAKERPAGFNVNVIPERQAIIQVKHSLEIFSVSILLKKGNDSSKS